MATGALNSIKTQHEEISLFEYQTWIEDISALEMLASILFMLLWIQDWYEAVWSHKGPGCVAL